MKHAHSLGSRKKILNLKNPVSFLRTKVTLSFPSSRSWASNILLPADSIMHRFLLLLLPRLIKFAYSLSPGRSKVLRLQNFFVTLAPSAARSRSSRRSGRKLIHASRKSEPLFTSQTLLLLLFSGQNNTLFIRYLTPRSSSFFSD